MKPRGTFLVRMCLWAFLAFACRDAAGAHASGLNQLTDIRHWSAPTYTRIVLDLQREPTFESFTLTNPSRIVVDVVSVAPRVPRDRLVINDNIVQRVRAAGSGSDRVRIVIDLERDAEHTIFALGAIDAKPPRLVIDVSRPDLEAAERQSRTQVREAARPGTRIVVVDPGHGGEDPGAVGRGKLYEKDIVLAMSRRLVNSLNRQQGIRAYLTRTGDYFIPLAKRVEIARQYGADLFISMHADASFNTRAAGSSVYCLSFQGASSNTARMAARKENASDFIGGMPLGRAGDDLNNIIFDLVQTRSLNAGLRLAGLVLKDIAAVNRLHTKHPQQANFAVLRAPHIPSVLIETDFLSNPARARRLLDKNFQEVFARHVTRAVVAFLKDEPDRPSTQRPSRHVVKRGDTLSGIAARYGTSVPELRRLNGMRSSDVLRAGRTLKLPGGAGPAAAVPSQAKPPSRHVVKRGETLSGIAARYGTSVPELRSLNGMRSGDVLRAGRTLKLPGAAVVPPAAPAPRPSWHVVKRGETLSGIAARYGTSVPELRRLNGMRPGTVLRAGAKLRLM